MAKFITSLKEAIKIKDLAKSNLIHVPHTIVTKLN